MGRCREDQVAFPRRASSPGQVSNHGAHVDAEGVTLLHRGGAYEVAPGTIRVVPTAAGADPVVVVNGRQLGGDYDAITSDECAKRTRPR